MSKMIRLIPLRPGINKAVFPLGWRDEKRWGQMQKKGTQLRVVIQSGLRERRTHDAQATTSNTDVMQCDSRYSTLLDLGINERNLKVDIIPPNRSLSEVPHFRLQV